MNTRLLRVGAWLWALLLLLACALGADAFLRQGARFDTDITALLPQSAESALVQHANRQLGEAFNDHFLLLVEAPELAEVSRALVDTLEQSDAVSGVQWQRDDFIQGDPLALLGPSRYRLLDPELATRIESGDTEELREEARGQLLIPFGLDHHPLRDPFGLLDRHIARIAPQGVGSDDGRLEITDGERRLGLVIGQLAGAPYAQSTQDGLESALASFSAAHPQARLVRSGMVFHAAAGAAQARTETGLIGTIELVSLIALLLLVFRSLKTLATLLLPLAMAILFAFSLTAWGFGRINLMTLAFGTSLIGIAVDYAIHLQCLRAAQGKRFVLGDVAPGLTLGLVCSLLAYAAQVLTPLPGLRQMAVFVMLGLAAAWATTLLWLPLLPAPPAHGVERAARLCWSLQARLRGRLPPLLLACAAAVLALLALLYSSSNDSLRLLNTSPTALLDDEREVQRLLERDAGTRYLLVEAPSVEAWLERVESITPSLQALVDAQHLGGFDSLATRVPSHARQDRDLALVRTLYTAELDALYRDTGLPESLVPRALESLDDPPYLELETWLESPLGTADRRLWLGSSENEAPRVAGMIPLEGAFDAQARAGVEALAASQPGLTLVDRVEEISAALGRLRVEIGTWVSLAFAAILALMALRYRASAWRVVAPPLGAVLLVLGVYAAFGVSLNLFHLLALLLVLGLGMDAGIFTAEHPRSAHVWLAVTLSALANLLAFGLLAFSAVPVLHAIGLTALLGLLGVWLLVPLVQRRDPPPLDFRT